MPSSEEVMVPRLRLLLVTVRVALIVLVPPPSGQSCRVGSHGRAFAGKLHSAIPAAASSAATSIASTSLSHLLSTNPLLISLLLPGRCLPAILDRASSSRSSCRGHA